MKFFSSINKLTEYDKIDVKNFQAYIKELGIMPGRMISKIFPRPRLSLIKKRNFIKMIIDKLGKIY